MEVDHFKEVDNKTTYVNCITSVTPGRDIRLFNSSIVNLETAIIERVFLVDGELPPSTNIKIFREMLRPFSSRLMKILPITSRQTKSQFMRTSCPAHKKKVYQRALDSLSHQPLTHADAVVTSFVKVEKTDFTTKERPVPRVIQPRNPRYHVELGRYLLPLEKVIFKKIDVLFGSKTIAKGCNYVQTAKIINDKWSHFLEPVGVGLDAKRFDQHVSVSALKWEHAIYKRCFKKDSYLNYLLGLQLVNVGKGYTKDGRLRYTKHGCRMSGDVNTSLGNTLLMCAMLYMYNKQFKHHVEVINNGDDSVVFMERKYASSYIKPINQFFKRLGFNMTVEEPVYVLEEVEFCQTHPVLNNGRYVMCRNPHTAITKDLYNFKPVFGSDKCYRRWLAAIGIGGMCSAGGFPIFQEFYHCLITNSFGAKPNYNLLERYYVSRKPDNQHYHYITSQERVSFHKAFGVTYDCQIMMENHFKSLKLPYHVPIDVNHHHKVPLVQFLF